MTPTQTTVRFYWSELPALRHFSSKLSPGKPTLTYKWIGTFSMSQRDEEGREARESAFEADAELRELRASEGLEHLEREEPESGQIAGNPFRRLIEGYEEQSARKPLDAQAHFQFGRQFLQVYLYDWALKAFARALEIAPRWADAQYYYANSLFMAGRLDEAEQEYVKARELDPKMMEARVEQELLRIKKAKAEQNGH